MKERGIMENSGQANTSVRTVDLTGTKCPMTFVRAKVALARMGEGQAAELVLLAGEQMQTMPASLKAEGHKIETVTRDGERVRLLVRKGVS